MQQHQMRLGLIGLGQAGALILEVLFLAGPAARFVTGQLMTTRMR
jgi:hypothetical protein